VFHVLTWFNLLQEVIDSVQGMLRELHAGYGALVTKYDSLECCMAVAGGNGDAFRSLQQVVHGLDVKLQALEESNHQAVDTLQQVNSCAVG
jgi:hypothetical protein